MNKLKTAKVGIILLLIVLGIAFALMAWYFMQVAIDFAAYDTTSSLIAAVLSVLCAAAVGLLMSKNPLCAPTAWAAITGNVLAETHARAMCQEPTAIWVGASLACVCLTAVLYTLAQRAND